MASVGRPAPCRALLRPPGAGAARAARPRTNGTAAVVPSLLPLPGSPALTLGCCPCSCLGRQGHGPRATDAPVTPLGGDWICSGWGVGGASQPLPMPRAGLGAAGTNPGPVSASLQALTPCSPAVNYEPVSEPPPREPWVAGRAVGTLGGMGRPVLHWAWGFLCLGASRCEFPAPKIARVLCWR